MHKRKNKDIHNVTFLTGNVKKLQEAQKILGNKFIVENVKLDLPEIQSTNVEDVIKEKVKAAYKKLKKPCFAEDTGVYIDNMNGFPGALIKFYFESVGNKGISKFNGGSNAYAETIIGYHDGNDVHFFKGRVNGRIAEMPQGEGFGWDPIFIPLINPRNDKSFAEMSINEKNKVSMRGKAFRNFKKFYN